MFIKYDFDFIWKPESELKYIVNKIAEVKECTPEKIAKITYENAMKVFRCF